MSQTQAVKTRTVSRTPRRKHNLYQKRKRLQFLTKFLAFLLAFVLVVPIAFADENDNGGTKTSFLVNTAVHMVATIAGTQVEVDPSQGEDPPKYKLSEIDESDPNAAYISNTDKTLDDILSVDFSSGAPEAAGGIDLSSLTGEDGICSKICKICEGVALALAIAIFCVSWMQAYLDGNVMEETWIRKFAIFGCSLAGIFFAQKICLLIASLGSAVAHAVAATPVENTDVIEVANQISEACYWKAGFIGTIADIDGWLATIVLRPIGFIAALLIPFIAVYAANLIVYFTAWGRAIEVFLVSAFSPFGMINIEHGFEKPMRFLKSVFALGIQGGIIMAALRVCRTMQVSAIASAFKGGAASLSAASFFSVIVIIALEAGLVSRSRSIAQSIVS